jgi:peroxiredoxin
MPRIRSLGASLVAVTPELPDHSLTMQQKEKLEFPVLSDLGNQVARRYRLVFVMPWKLRLLYRFGGHINLAHYNGDRSWTLPMPGTFLLDRDRTVRAAFVQADYTLRMETAAMLAALERLCAPPPLAEERIDPA